MQNASAFVCLLFPYSYSHIMPLTEIINEVSFQSVAVFTTCVHTHTCVQLQIYAPVCGDQKMTLESMPQALSITLILRHNHSLA